MTFSLTFKYGKLIHGGAYSLAALSAWNTCPLDIHLAASSHHAGVKSNISSLAALLDDLNKKQCLFWSPPLLLNPTLQSLHHSTHLQVPRIIYVGLQIYGLFPLSH